MKLVGATHAAEIPFVFGNMHDLPLPNGTCQMTPDDLAISEFMKQAWTTMAASQKPTSEVESWPAYQNAQNSTGINILNSSVAGYVNYTVCQLWDTMDAAQVATAYNKISLNATSTAVSTPKATAAVSVNTSNRSSAANSAVVSMGRSKVISFAILYLMPLI